ncbi:MAG: hypothetical protein CMN76_09720 [Spirochaetaceae bacterium]|nr:hypothetical protein [Spirochaetaceae bacterium]
MARKKATPASTKQDDAHGGANAGGAAGQEVPVSPEAWMPGGDHGGREPASLEGPQGRQTVTGALLYDVGARAYRQNVERFATIRKIVRHGVPQ